MLAATVAVAAAVALIRLTSGDAQVQRGPGDATAPDVREEATRSGPAEPSGAAFTTATGAVLVTEDGGTGIHAVVVDTGAAHEPRLLGEASYFVPSAEPGELWLIDRPDWRGDTEPPTWTLVDHAGTPLHRVQAEAGFEVERGVPGGLAVRGDDEVLRRYVRSTGEITDLVGGPGARILDVTPSLLLWCEADCTTLQVTSGRRTVQLGEDEVTEFLGGWVSSDGATVAAHAAVETADGARDFELRVYDLTEEALVDRTAVQLGEVHAAWTPAGDQLLFRVAVEQGPSTFGRHTGSGFEIAEHDPLEGSRPVPFLVGHATWYPDLGSGTGHDER